MTRIHATTPTMSRGAVLAGAVLTAVVASLVAIPLAEADPRPKRSKTYAKPYPEPRRLYDDRDRWYPNDANQLRVGSRIWWDQMEKEGRIGRPSSR